MVRLLAILVILAIGLGAIAVAAVSLTFKLLGALFWIVLAMGAYLLWSRSRQAGP